MLGWVSLVFAVIAAASVTMIGFTSFTAFDPPGWLRISTMVPLPFALIVSIVCAVLALRKPSGRAAAIVALVIDGLVIAAFAVMISSGG